MFFLGNIIYCSCSIALIFIKGKILKRKILLTIVAASLLTSQAVATNGDNLIATGAKSRAMGGTQVSANHGAESAMYNPAMIADVKESISASVMLFNADVTAATLAGEKTSQTDPSIIPNMAYVKPINKEFTAGFAVFGAAGMGVDYSGHAELANMETELMLLKISAPFAYKATDVFTVGLAPVITYGSLRINGDFANGAGGVNSKHDDATTDAALGFEAGLSYKLSSELNLALVYKSATKLTYKDQIATAASYFGLTGISNTLEQPSEMGLGFSYHGENNRVNMDIKTIRWAETEGYGDFNWDNQNVVAIGYSYVSNGWSISAGFNRSETTLTERSLTSGNDASAINQLNLIGFPATSETAYSLGVTFDMSKTLTLVSAIVISPEVTNVYNSWFDADNNGVPETQATVTNTHAEQSFSIGINYLF